jgi:hypothetical protein
MLLRRTWLHKIQTPPNLGLNLSLNFLTIKYNVNIDATISDRPLVDFLMMHHTIQYYCLFELGPLEGIHTLELSDGTMFIFYQSPGDRLKIRVFCEERTTLIYSFIEIQLLLACANSHKDFQVSTGPLSSFSSCDTSITPGKHMELCASHTPEMAARGANSNVEAEASLMHKGCESLGNEIRGSRG